MSGKNFILRKEILIIDDDPVSTYLTEELLLDHFNNLKIQKFSSGKDCLAYLKNKKDEAVILLDLNMPEMNGWEFLKFYREIGINDPIILLTSSINDDDRKRAAQEKIYFLNKPIDPSLLDKFVYLAPAL